MVQRAEMHSQAVAKIDWVAIVPLWHDSTC
jgi:hypothetical protein